MSLILDGVNLKSLNLKKGDEVIIPTFTIISSILCIIKLGLKPVLVDSDLESWNMSTKETLNKITNKTKAIIITHIYGFPVDMKKILFTAKQRRIKIKEVQMRAKALKKIISPLWCIKECYYCVRI